MVLIYVVDKVGIAVLGFISTFGNKGFPWEYNKINLYFEYSKVLRSISF